MRLDFLNVRMQVDDQTLISNDPMEILKPVWYSANIMMVKLPITSVCGIF
jgi:hypothetical protein